ncbi:hypothetical protein FB45DRAFT_1052117, partial [Roridomyces roridus]
MLSFLSSAVTKDDHHALAHLLRVSAAADMTRSIEFPSKKKPDASSSKMERRLDRLLPQGSDCTSQEKMKLHQPPTPACAPNTLNLSPTHPGTTGARGPSSGTSDVVDHLRQKPHRVQVLAAGTEVPTPREGFKTARGPHGFGRHWRVSCPLVHTSSAGCAEARCSHGDLSRRRRRRPRWSWIGLVVRYMQAQLRGSEDEEDTER